MTKQTRTKYSTNGEEREPLYSNGEEREPLYSNGEEREPLYTDNEEGSSRTPGHGANAWSCWFRIWVTPTAGWKRMRNSRLSGSAMESGVFYPLTALTAMGAFARMFYGTETTISNCLIEATCIFVTLFASYFLIFPLAKLLMRSDCSARVESEFGRCYVASLLATEALFFFLYECLPFMEVMLAFTPAYTIYLSFKGIPILRIPKERQVSTWVALVLLILALPILLYQLLGIMLPVNMEPR